MRGLFLIPGDAVSQLQSLPAVAAVAQHLNFRMQVACHPAAAGIWTLLPAVEKVIPFAFDQASLADWANLLGSVRDPDFQVCVNLASGRQVDLMLSMSHIPTRIAAGGFSATTQVTPARGIWPDQALEAYLSPIGVPLQADAFRLTLPRKAIEAAQASLPPGDGPMLLLARAGTASDWPAERWQRLPDSIRSKLPSLRSHLGDAASPAPEPLMERAALVASSDVILASDPLTSELALLCGVPLVALGRAPETLPARDGVRGLVAAGGLADLAEDTVLGALGLG